MKSIKNIHSLSLALLVLFLLAACNMPADNLPVDTDKAMGFPTELPEVIQEVIEEAEEIEEEVESQTQTLPIMSMNAAQMLNNAAQDKTESYGDLIKDMLYTRAIDLAVTNIQDGTGSPQLGHQFEAIVTVHNIGYAASPQVKLSCEVAETDGLGGWQWVAPLAAGESRDIRIGFTGLESGTYDYTCTIDSDNTLVEFNKLNNSLTTSINVTMSRVDLLIADVQNISKAPVIGYENEFLITVENAGPQRSYLVLLRCSYVEGLASTQEHIVYVGDLKNAGDQVSVICGFNGVPSGTYELTVEVDWGNMMDEFDEKNNIAVIEFKAR